MSCSKDIYETSSMRETREGKQSQNICSEAGTHTCGQNTVWETPLTPVTTLFQTYVLTEQKVLPSNGEDL